MAVKDPKEHFKDIFGPLGISTPPRILPFNSKGYPNFEAILVASDDAGIVCCISFIYREDVNPGRDTIQKDINGFFTPLEEQGLTDERFFIWGAAVPMIKKYCLGTQKFKKTGDGKIDRYSFISHLFPEEEFQNLARSLSNRDTADRNTADGILRAVKNSFDFPLPKDFIEKYFSENNALPAYDELIEKCHLERCKNYYAILDSCKLVEKYGKTLLALYEDEVNRGGKWCNKKEIKQKYFKKNEERKLAEWIKQL